MGLDIKKFFGKDEEKTKDEMKSSVLDTSTDQFILSITGRGKVKTMVKKGVTHVIIEEIPEKEKKPSPMYY